MEEPDHVPVPAEHAPRKDSSETPSGRLLVYEEANPKAWIETEDPIPVEQ